MTDESGTEIHPSDVVSAEEFLFGHATDDTPADVGGELPAGDAADDAPVDVDEEQDADGETAEEPDVADGGGVQPAQGETETTEELKVVLSIRGDRATIGVQQPSLRTRTSSPSMTWTWPGWPWRSRRWSKGPGPGGRTNPGTRPTRDPLPRPAAGPGVSRGRRQLQPPKERGTSSSPRRCGCSEDRTLERNVRLGLTWQAAVRTGVGHLPSGATACVGVFCIRGGNCNRDEPAGGQRFLFYRAEFLAEEPAQPRGRNGRPKPSSLSFSEWALTAGQQRERELFGAGRLVNAAPEGQPSPATRWFPWLTGYVWPLVRFRARESRCTDRYSSARPRLATR